MKNQMKKLVAAGLLIICGTYVAAQVPPPAPMPPAAAGASGLLPSPAPDNGPFQPGGPRRQPTLQSLTTINGRVIAYTANDRYAYNSLTLQGNNGTTNVRFPEHLGQQLMNAAKKGEKITVKGFSMTGPDGITAFQLVTATVGSTQIIDTPPVPPAQSVTPEPKTYSGSISDFRRDPQGTINGLTLDNKVVIDLPPPATAQLQALLKTGDKVDVSGFKDTTPAGVVLAAGAPMFIHPQTITLNGQTYLLR